MHEAKKNVIEDHEKIVTTIKSDKGEKIICQMTNEDEYVDIGVVKKSSTETEHTNNSRESAYEKIKGNLP